MKQGQIVAKGTIAELKEKYAVGHIVEIKFHNNSDLCKKADNVLEKLREKLGEKVFEKERLSVCYLNVILI